MLTKHDLLSQIDTCMVIEYAESERRGTTICRHLIQLGIYPTKEAFRAFKECMAELVMENGAMFRRFDTSSNRGLGVRLRANSDF